MTQVLPSEDPADEALEAQFESSGNPWPCAVMVLIVCLTFLGICLGGVYMVVNLRQ